VSLEGPFVDVTSISPPNRHLHIEDTIVIGVVTLASRSHGHKVKRHLNQFICPQSRRIDLSNEP